METPYPLLRIGVRTRPGDMSFAVADDAADVEGCDRSLRTVFPQSRHIVRLKLLRVLGDSGRSHRAARRRLNEPENLGHTLEESLESGRYSPSVIEWHVVPLGAVN